MYVRFRMKFYDILFQRLNQLKSSQGRQYLSYAYLEYAGNYLYVIVLYIIILL